MLQTILGLHADVPNHKLYIQPTLPGWLPDIALEHLRVSSCSLSLRFWREDDRSHWEACDMKASRPQDKIQVVAED